MPHQPHPLADAKIPSAIVTIVSDLMHAAETHFVAPASGPAKKQWVIDAACAALKHVDIPAIPEWIETPLERVVISLIVEVVWALAFQPPDSGDGGA